jgi:hypothetical protein
VSQKTLKRILDRVLSGGGEFRDRSATTTRRIGEESTPDVLIGRARRRLPGDVRYARSCASRRRRSAALARDPSHGPSTFCLANPGQTIRAVVSCSSPQRRRVAIISSCSVLCRSEREAWTGLENLAQGCEFPRVGFALWIGDPCRWGGVIAPSGRWRRSPATFMIGYVFGRVGQTPAMQKSEALARTPRTHGQHTENRRSAMKRRTGALRTCCQMRLL